MQENILPYLQLDLSGRFGAEDKKRLAAAMCETYSRMMSVDVQRVTIAIREVGEEAVWKVAEVGGEPVPASMLMLDIRQVRPLEKRKAVADALCTHCIEILGIERDSLNVVFTQHPSEDMYHPSLGGFSPDWEPNQL